MNSMDSKSAKPACEGAERILKAAEELFSEFGFDAVSMNAIADRAGVSKANIFHHFKSKNDLYIAVIRSACDEAGGYLDQFGSDEGDFSQRFQRFSRDQLEHMLQKPEISRLIQRDLLDQKDNHGQELAEGVFSGHFSRLVKIIRDGQEKGELRKDVDPALLAVMVIELNDAFFMSRDIYRHFPEVGFMDDSARYNQMVVDILLNGILPKNTK